MIALRLTYNGNPDWVDPFPRSFLQSCHSPGVTVVLRGPGMALTAGTPSACGKII
jgi:hypothetical protein